MKKIFFLNGASLCIFIVLLLAIIYYPITSLGFANMDDKWMLLDDKMVHPAVADMNYLRVLFKSFNSVQYSPANTLYYLTVFLINGYDPYWYHLSGLLIHIINVGLIYLFIKQVLELFKNTSASIIASICCLLWSVHPLNVEAVVWVSASKVLLYTMFTLMALLAMLRFALSRSKIYYSISFISFTIACFCKEQALILPVTLTAFLVIFYFAEIKISAKFWLLACIPFFIVALAFGVVTFAAQQTAYGKGEAASLYVFFDRFVFSFYCLCFYLLDAILPINLHYQYDYPMKPGQSLPMLYYAFPIAFALIVSFIIYFLKSHSARAVCIFWLLFFLINIFLCIQVVPMRRPAIMADRYMYLPILGLMVPVIILINEFYKTFSYKNRIILNGVFFFGGLIYFSFLIITSSQMAANWQQYNLIVK